jgi:predicted nuclease of predicted toxin-antitoxin system
MRFRANENFPLDAVTALRTAGHDVAWVRADAPGSTDRQVLDRAIAEERVLLTLDKDFGEMAFHSGLPPACCVVLCRFQAPSAAVLARWVLAAIQARTDWAGHFSVAEPARIRMRPLPSAGLPSTGAGPASGAEPA